MPRKVSPIAAFGAGIVASAVASAVIAIAVPRSIAHPPELDHRLHTDFSRGFGKRSLLFPRP